MEWALVVSRNHDKEIAAADYPKIRLYTVPKRQAAQPATDVEAEWLVCSKRTVSYFSAVDTKFVSAHAEIDGLTAVVWSDVVPKPVAVRFAWHQVAEPNLMNNAGLPASPFRTDR